MTKKELKTHLLALGLLLATLLVWSFLDSRGVFKISLNQVLGTNSTATLLLHYNDGRTREFRGKVVEDMTILDALWAASRGGGFEIQYGADRNGLKLLSLNGQNHGDTGKSWLIYLNGQLVEETQIDRITIKKGDLVEVKP